VVSTNADNSQPNVSAQIITRGAILALGYKSLRELGIKIHQPAAL